MVSGNPLPDGEPVKPPAAQPPAEPSPEAQGAPETNRDYVGSRAKEEAIDWVKDTAKGIVKAVAILLAGMLLVQIGLAREGQEFSFDLFAPYEFWVSFSGLVVYWSEWNEWLLLGLGLLALLVTVAVAYYVLRKRRKQAQADTQDVVHVAPPGDNTQKVRKPLLRRAEEALGSMQTVGAFALLAALLLGAYAYQQYLWNVELPVPREQIGVAFTRQVGGTVARDQLADYLRQMGHEGRIVMRDLPVTFDARDTARAQQFARRIGADAIIILREESLLTSARPGVPVASGTLQRSPGRASVQASTRSNVQTFRHVAYIVFADPSLGVEIPVPQRSAGGKVESVVYRTKEGVEVPRLEADDLGRLMEAAAGILMYDQDRYLPAIAHLRNSLAGSNRADGSTGLLQFYLGNAYYLVDQDDPAREAFDAAIGTLEGFDRLTVQDRLLLAQAYSYRAEYYLFDNRDRKLEEGEALLRKAVALREPLDKDESALADPVTYRRAHDVFGTAYVRLMESANLRDDKDAAALWTSRAKEEAATLAAREDDDRAFTRATWITFLTGDCEQAYKMAQDLLARRPNDILAHRLLARIAHLRDGDITTLETKVHVDALLRINPRSLPDLQTLMLYYAWHLNTDPGYLDDLKATGDRILEIDPNNVEALDSYLSQVVIYAGAEMRSALSTLFGAPGHAPTFARQQSEWPTDARHVRGVLAQLDAARSYATRWAEEVQPEAAAPVLYSARLNRRAEDLLYFYTLFSFLRDSGPSNADPELIGLYEPTWERAANAANGVLDPKRNATPLEAARAHTLLSELYTDRSLLRSVTGGKDAPADSEAIQKALEHAQEAARLVDANPSEALEYYELSGTVYGDLALAALGARNYYRDQGNAELDKRYDDLYNASFARWQALGLQTPPRFEAENGLIERLASCEGGNLLRDGSAALSRGDTARAIDLLGQYLDKYPGDPQGVAVLAWAQYIAGDLDAALATAERFERMAPDNPYGPHYRMLIALAQGISATGEADARGALAGTLEKLGSRPLGVRLEVLGGMASDLSDLARTKAGARAGVKALLPDFRKYLDGLPPDTDADYGSRLVLVLRNLGLAAVWAEDYPAAEAYFNSGLEINPDYTQMRASLGLPKLASGDTSGAQAAYEQAIAFAEASLEGAAEEEKAQAGSIATGELEGAAAELEQLLEIRPDLASAGRPIAESLRRAAATLK